MQNQLEENQNPPTDGSCKRGTDSLKNVSNAIPSTFGMGLGKNNCNDNKLIESRQKLLSSIVLRLTKSERNLLDSLSHDYAESLVTIISKSLRLYRGIVEAVEQGGSLLMIKTPSSAEHRSSINPNDSYETVIAVREQFANKGETPIALNRAYINASKGLKTERLAIRVNSAIVEGLVDLERQTGLSKSSILRDGMHLYNFVKREFEKSDISFYIGGTLIKGI